MALTVTSKQAPDLVLQGQHISLGIIKFPKGQVTNTVILNFSDSIYLRYISHVGPTVGNQVPFSGRYVRSFFSRSGKLTLQLNGEHDGRLSGSFNYGKFVYTFTGLVVLENVDEAGIPIGGGSGSGPLVTDRQVPKDTSPVQPLAEDKPFVDGELQEISRSLDVVANRLARHAGRSS